MKQEGAVYLKAASIDKEFANSVALTNMTGNLKQIEDDGSEWKEFLYNCDETQQATILVEAFMRCNNSGHLIKWPTANSPERLAVQQIIPIIQLNFIYNFSFTAIIHLCP